MLNMDGFVANIQFIFNIGGSKQAYRTQDTRLLEGTDKLLWFMQDINYS